MRNQCKGCPWMVKTEHNTKWKKWVNHLFNIGIRDSKVHSCHMIEKNPWVKHTDKTVCVGSENNSK